MHSLAGGGSAAAERGAARAAEEADVRVVDGAAAPVVVVVAMVEARAMVALAAVSLITKRISKQFVRAVWTCLQQRSS